MNERCKSLLLLCLINQKNLLQDQETPKTKRANLLPLIRILKVAVSTKAAKVNLALQVLAKRCTNLSSHVVNPLEYQGQLKSKKFPANEGSKAHQKSLKAVKVLTVCLKTSKNKLRFPPKRNKTKTFCL
jgi:hypothetical protein